MGTMKNSKESESSLRDITILLAECQFVYKNIGAIVRFTTNADV